MDDHLRAEPSSRAGERSRAELSKRMVPTIGLGPAVEPHHETCTAAAHPIVGNETLTRVSEAEVHDHRGAALHPFLNRGSNARSAERLVSLGTLACSKTLASSPD